MAATVEVERRDSLKLRVRLERARLVRALEQAKVRSVAVVVEEVVEVKLKSISASDGKKASSSMAAKWCVICLPFLEMTWLL